MHPILFSFGPINLYSYGALVSIGIFLSIFILRRNAHRVSLTPDTTTDLVIAAVVSGFIGARVFYILQFWNHFVSAPLDVFKMWEGGIVFYGGVFGALLGSYIAARVKKLSFINVLDLLLPVVALTHAFGRIGCFLNGCCYGNACDLPWAVQYSFLEGKVHPTQVYEAIFCFVLSFFLFKLWHKKPNGGSVTAAYFILYPIGRFVMEFFRGDNTHYLFNLTLQQWISILIVSITFIVITIYGKQRIRRSS